MATTKTRTRQTILRLKGFFKTITSTKRGLVGIIGIAIFVPIGLIGPLTTILDPLSPQWPGYYPAGPVPATTDLCVPAWYLYLPGGRQKYCENMEAVSDYKFSSDPFISPTKWSWAISSPEVDLSWNPSSGSLNDGAIEISYQTQVTDTLPRAVGVALNYSFVYSYDAPPTRFFIHQSMLAEGSVSPNLRVSMELSLYRKDSAPLTDYAYPERDPLTRKKLITQENSLWVYEYPLITYTYSSPIQPYSHFWTRSTKDELWNNPKWQWKVEETIFPRSGNYTFSIRLLFDDKGGGGKSAKVYLDNVNILIYGNAFGLLGSTDASMGTPRDIYTGMVYGARISVFIGLLVACISVFLGLFVGMTAGYSGGLTDEALMRFADFLIGLPGLPLLIVLAYLLNPSVWNIVMLLSVMGWMGFSRNVRSMTLSLRERAFVEAAKASGAGRGRILIKHVVPNVFPLVYLALATAVPGAIVAEASLSFLGLFDPTMMTWGRMLNEFARSGVAVTKGFTEYWFWVIPPGIAISVLAISFIMIGYALDETLNPKLRRRR